MTVFPDHRRTWPRDASRMTWHAADGWPLRVFDRPANGRRGSILSLGGRGDFIEKYLEIHEQWHHEGWHVTAFDWRGQAGSGRLLAGNTGHIDDFATWLDDLAAFWREWVARTPAPHVVMGHSMGGHLVLRALVESRIAPVAAILSAPMLGFDSGGVASWIAPRVAAMLGRAAPTRRAWRENERPARPGETREHFLTHDAARYADEIWWRTQDASLALGPPSWSWIAAAYRSFASIERTGAVERVAQPVLTVATEGDRLVDPTATRRIAARLPRGELLMFGREVAHEVLREVDRVRDEALDRIAAFLDRHAPPR